MATVGTLMHSERCSRDRVGPLWLSLQTRRTNHVTPGPRNTGLVQGLLVAISRKDRPSNNRLQATVGGLGVDMPARWAFARRA